MKIIVIVSLCIFGLLALARYVYRMKLIRSQDQEIKKLNAIIFEKNDFIQELIHKYGVTPENMKKIKAKLRKEINKIQKKEP